MAIVVVPPMYVWGYRVPDDLARNFVVSVPCQATPCLGSLPFFYYVPHVAAMQTMSQQRTDLSLLLGLARIREFGYTETVLWLEEDPWPWQLWPHLHNYLAASPHGTWYPRRRRQQRSGRVERGMWSLERQRGMERGSRTAVRLCIQRCTIVSLRVREETRETLRTERV